MFGEEGFVRVEKAFSPGDASAICDVLWSVFEREFGIRRSDPQSWSRPFRKRPLDQIGSMPVFTSVFTDEVRSVVDELLGVGKWQWPHPGEFLITFPNASSWELPHQGWHQDWAFKEATNPLRFFKTFFYLNDIGTGGGGTLVVQGSHRLVGRYAEGRVQDDRGRNMKGSERLYQDCHWLRDLCTSGDTRERYRRFVDEATDVGGVNLKVVELTGKPGDVVFVHPCLIHAIAPNAAANPRFMPAAVFHVDELEPERMN